ncbi:hypothetical protein ACTXT7_011030 [Hymenolepis weldensis]
MDVRLAIDKYNYPLPESSSRYRQARAVYLSARSLRIERMRTNNLGSTRAIPVLVESKGSSITQFYVQMFHALVN